jgi:hypothetical protein
VAREDTTAGAAAARSATAWMSEPGRRVLLAAVVEAQVRLAFPRPVVVRLQGVAELPNRDHTLAIRVAEAAELDAARRRLFDATHLALGAFREWPWHITWIRYGIRCDSVAMLALAARELAIDESWSIDRVSLLERGESSYSQLAEWRLA